MEILLLASGAFLAYQKMAPLAESSPPEDDSTTPTVSTTYYPDDKFYNYAPRSQAPLVSQPVSRGKPLPPPPSNPVQLQMMEDIRNPVKHTSSAAPFRPSWLRNAVDEGAASQERREREQRQENVPPPGYGENMHAFQGAYRASSINTLNAFGQGGLPEEQQYVRPDGLDPVAANRKMTERFHQYTLDHDLTAMAGDDGRTRGVAVGQERGGLVRQEGWSLNQDRAMQMQASTGIKPSNAGIRSSGTGVPLSSFIGQQPVEPLESMRGNHEVEPDVGRKGAVGKLPVRPSDDPLDKRFVYEQVNALERAEGASHMSTISSGLGAGFRGEHDAMRVPGLDSHNASELVGMKNPIPKPTSDAVDKTEWKFSYDIKKLFDLSTTEPTLKTRNAVLSAPQDRRGAVLDMVEDDAVQRVIVDVAPQTKNAANFGGISTFKTDTASSEKRVVTTNFKALKSQISNPTGSGRSAPLKEGGLVGKKAAIDDGIIYGNDEILEKAALAKKPLKAPKSTLPDYTLAKENASRSLGEFRKR